MPSFQKYRRVPWILACCLAALAERRNARPTLIAKSSFATVMRFNFNSTFPVIGELVPNCHRKPKAAMRRGCFALALIPSVFKKP